MGRVPLRGRDALDLGVDAHLVEETDHLARGRSRGRSRGRVRVGV